MRPESRRRSALLLFDAVVVVSAFVFSLAAVWVVNDMYAVRDNDIWLVVMSTVATFHVFPAVLLTGWYLRKKVFAAA